MRKKALIDFKISTVLTPKVFFRFWLHSLLCVSLTWMILFRAILSKLFLSFFSSLFGAIWQVLFFADISLELFYSAMLYIPIFRNKSSRRYFFGHTLHGTIFHFFLFESILFGDIYSGLLFSESFIFQLSFQIYHFRKYFGSFAIIDELAPKLSTS